MKHNIGTALAELAPYQEYVVYDNDFDRIVWFPEKNTIPKPSREEIEAKIAELDAAEPMRQLRIYRDRFLAETDWVVTKANELGEEVPAEWKAYRQALRDITNTATPELNEEYNLDITTIDWPTKPA